MRNLTVLCAEDEPDLRRDLVEELSDAGYNVIEASNGEDALMAIDALEPDIVLCDINMPRMSGLDVLSYIRNGTGKASDVPFIFLTAFGEKSDMLKGRQLGADDYLVKPVDFDILLATMDARLAGAGRAKRMLAIKSSELEEKLNYVLAHTQPFCQKLPEEAALRYALESIDLTDTSLIVASLDGRHRLASQFGVAAAQNILIAFQQRLLACACDHDRQLFQIGADITCLVVRNEKGCSEVHESALALSDFTAEVSSHRLPLSASATIARRQDGDRRPSGEILDDAILALRVAQREGGRSVIYLDEPALGRARIVQFIETNFVHALNSDELSLVFQPKIDLQTGRVIGAEALLRWHSGERGTIPPSLFIPIVERCGFVDIVSDWVLDRAAKVLSELWQEGIKTTISVNASGAELHAHFVARVEKAVVQHQIPFGSLEVEITETSVILDLAFAADIAADLKRIGIGIAVDDFGTGYSSFSYLRSLPLDTVKIDQSFIRGASINAVDRQIVESVVGLAHAVGLKTVAEGIETQEQMTLLRNLGCDYAQGYLIAKPLTLADFKEFARIGFIY